MVPLKRFFIRIVCTISIILITGCRLTHDNAPQTSDLENSPQEQRASWRRDATLSSQQPCLHTATIFSPDNRYFVAAYHNGTIEIWDLESKTLLRSWTIPQSIRSFSFSPDGTQLAGTSNGEVDNIIYVWKWPTGTLLHELHSHTTTRCTERFCYEKNCCCTVNFLNYTTNGQALISASSKNGELNFWNPQSGQLLKRLCIAMKGSAGLEAIAISPDGTLIASTLNDEFYPTERYADLDPEMSYDYRNEVCVQLWNGRTGSLIKTIPTGMIEPAREISSNELSFSADGTHLAVGCAKARICLINTQDWSAHKLDNSESKNRGGSLDERHTMLFSPRGDSLAATVGRDLYTTEPGGQRAAIIWDVNSGKIVQICNGGYQIAFSPDGQMLAICMLPADENSDQSATIDLLVNHN